MKNASISIIASSLLWLLTNIINTISAVRNGVLEYWSSWDIVSQFVWLVIPLGFTLAGFLLRKESKNEIQSSATAPEESPVVSVGDWVLTYLILCVPIVNIVMLFVWAFGSSTNPSKANWAKASLIWFAIVFVLYIIMVGAIIAALA